MGESATAMGRGRAVCPMPASRPTGRSGLGYPLEWRNLRLNCQWHTTTTASHCKVQRRCQFPSRCGAVTGPWISGHTDACKASFESCWRGRATRPIFDHRETGSAVLARAGARSGEVAESDRATVQAFIAPQDFGPLGRCTHIGVGARRDRFSTIEKRRCDCAAGRAQAGSVSASDGATGQAVCRLPRFGKLAL